jgi:hypothetical protein
MTRKPETQEIDRLRELLLLLFRIQGLSFKDVEKTVDLGYGHYSKVFTGLRDFRLEHILHFCEATGLSPAEFFHWAYPRLPRKPSAAAQKIYQMQEALLGRFEDTDGLQVEDLNLPRTLTEKHLAQMSEPTRREVLRILAAETA